MRSNWGKLRSTFFSAAASGRPPPGRVDEDLERRTALFAEKLNSTSLDTSRGMLRNLWALAKPYWWSDTGWKEKLIAYSLLVGALTLSTWNILHIQVATNEMSSQLGDVMQGLFGTADKGPWLAQMTDLMKTGLFIACEYMVAKALKDNMLMRAALRWRAHMTGRLIDGVMENDNAYRIRQSAKPVENPDQRIADDNRDLTDNGLQLLSDAYSSILAIYTFSNILWHMPGHLNLGLVGLPDWNVPHLMFAIGVALPVMANAGTFWLGRRLPAQEYEQQRLEANFRSSLKRVFENAEQIALSGVRVVERHILHNTFNAVAQNAKAILATRIKLSVFSSFYTDIADLAPYFGILAASIKNNLTMGSYTSGAVAFTQVQSALSFAVDNFGKIAQLGATAERLTELHDAITAANASASPAHNPSPPAPLPQLQAPGPS